MPACKLHVVVGIFISLFCVSCSHYIVNDRDFAEYLAERIINNQRCSNRSLAIEKLERLETCFSDTHSNSEYYQYHQIKCRAGVIPDILKRQALDCMSEFDHDRREFEV